MLADAADGRLEAFSTFEAALIAGAVSGEAVRRDSLSRLERLVERLPNTPDALETARAAHRLLREDVLTGPFQDDAFDVAATLRGGPYNCLTATILLNELCRRRGLKVAAMFVPGHVYTRIEAAPPFDVQITCADWFAQFSAGRSDPPNAAPRRLGETKLLARIYYNRGVRAHRGDDCESAVALLRSAVSLDPGDEASGRNLLAAQNNWALQQCGRGRYAAALEILASAGRDAPDYAPVRDNETYIRGCWADALCRQGRFGEAEEVLREGSRRAPGEAFFDRALRAVDEAKKQHAPGRLPDDLTAAGT